MRRAADEVLRLCPRIDCLLLNAGQGGEERRALTEDGLERVMTVNYFGHFLLTELLLARLKASKPARVVSIRCDNYLQSQCCCSSLIHAHTGPLGKHPEENLNLERPVKYVGIYAYAVSKLAQIWHARYMAAQLVDDGRAVFAVLW